MDDEDNSSDQCCCIVILITSAALFLAFIGSVTLAIDNEDEYKYYFEVRTILLGIIIVICLIIIISFIYYFTIYFHKILLFFNEINSFIHKKINAIRSRNIAINQNHTCTICLQTVSNDLKILNCNHVFHKKCIDIWLDQYNNFCPNCKKIPV
tara:strand:- start:52 stop:510 length:459 start_codon:yes stop_codon:yes gene_type:complete